MIMVPKYKSVMCVYSYYLSTPSPRTMITQDMKMMSYPNMKHAEMVEPTVSKAPVHVTDTPMKADVSIEPEDEEFEDHNHKDGDDAVMIPSYIPDRSPENEYRDDEEHCDDEGHGHGHEDDDKTHSTPDYNSTMDLSCTEPAEDEIFSPASITVTLIEGTIKSISNLASGVIVFGKHGS